jgi:hypothetical protein
MRLLLVLLVVLTACAAPPPPAEPEPAAPPTHILGSFTDDYGNEYEIAPKEWVQLPHGKFHIVEWHPAEQFLIAQNDSGNSSAPGRWTRIDWMDLPGMRPYYWAFCLSAYQAPTRDAARATAIARRETPRTGCNGFPFSRMKPKT